MKKSVLVIDDEPAVRIALTRVLERAGYSVRVAANGDEGLHDLRENGAQIVITDIIMPKTDGVETIAAIAREFPQVRIVAISGGGNYGVEYRPKAITTTAYLTAAEKAGAHAVLTKPFDSREVLEAIGHVQAPETGRGNGSEPA